MKRKSIMARLNTLKKKTGWSWEKMAREIHRSNKCDGITHTTLFRISKNVNKPHATTEKYISEGLDKLEKESR